MQANGNDGVRSLLSAFRQRLLESARSAQLVTDTLLATRVRGDGHDREWLPKGRSRILGKLDWTKTFCVNIFNVDTVTGGLT